MESDTKELETIVQRDSPKLIHVLREMTSGLDEVRDKVNQFLAKIRQGEFSTKKGISYLETKHLLLAFYCQSLLFYILMKAKGQSVKDHPVISRLVEIRMFLEKIRPIDKKLQYQIEKLLKMAAGPSGESGDGEIGPSDDLLYKPNPDMLVSKMDENDKEKDGIYRPPMIAPVSMEDDRLSKDKKEESRLRKDALRKASRSSLMKELANELEGRPEEIKPFVGAESKEMARELDRLEARAQVEENLFSRVPLSKMEKKKLKHLKKSRNGLMGMLDDFDDDIAHLVNLEVEKGSQSAAISSDKAYTNADTFLRNPKKTTKFKKQKPVLPYKKGERNYQKSKQMRKSR